MPLSYISQSSGLREDRQQNEDIVEQKQRKSSSGSNTCSKRPKEDSPSSAAGMTDNSVDAQRKTALGPQNNGFNRNSSHIAHTKGGSVKKLVIKNLKG